MAAAKGVAEVGRCCDLLSHPKNLRWRDLGRRGIFFGTSVGNDGCGRCNTSAFFGRRGCAMDVVAALRLRRDPRRFHRARLKSVGLESDNTRAESVPEVHLRKIPVLELADKGFPTDPMIQTASIQQSLPCCSVRATSQKTSKTLGFSSACPQRPAVAVASTWSRSAHSRRSTAHTSRVSWSISQAFRDSLPREAASMSKKKGCKKKKTCRKKSRSSQISIMTRSAHTAALLIITNLCLKD